MVLIGSNQTEVYLITFDIETMGLKEQVLIGDLDKYIDSSYSDESDQILIILQNLALVMSLNSNKELTYQSKDLFRDNRLKMNSPFSQAIVFQTEGLLGVIDTESKLNLFDRDTVHIGEFSLPKSNFLIFANSKGFLIILTDGTVKVYSVSPLDQSI